MSSGPGKAERLGGNHGREPVSPLDRRERGQRPGKSGSRDISVAWNVLERESMSGVSLPVRSPGVQLLGRAREREVLDRSLDGVRAGHAAVLVMRGEAGVGKTALLER